MTLTAGARLGHYEISTRLGRQAALKVLPADLPARTEALERLQREALLTIRGSFIVTSTLQNIFLTADGQVKILDFGLAHVLLTSDQTQSSPNLHE